MLQSLETVRISEIHDWSDQMEMVWDHQGSPFACTNLVDLTMASPEERQTYDDKRETVRRMKRNPVGASRESSCLAG